MDCILEDVKGVLCMFQPDEIDAFLEEEAGLGKSFDTGVRRLIVAGEPLHLYFVN